MTRIAYLDLASGASGDMLLAALADTGRNAGVDVESAIGHAVEGLGLGCSVAFEEAQRAGLRCLVAEVATDGERHTVERLRSAIRDAPAGSRAKARALAGLEALVRAEAKVHGVDPDDVHLHELGSADTAADLLGSAAGFEALGVSTLAAAAVPVPHGWIRGDHGDLPLPAPATLELLRRATLRGVDTEYELVTPTAAAVLSAHGCIYGPMPQLLLEEVGVGGGSRDTEHPNVCRLMVGQPLEVGDALEGPARGPRGVGIERAVLLETNIDDQPPEGIGHAIEALHSAGARDAWVTPIVMKKSRPAFQLSVLVDAADEAKVLEVVFRETTTLGVRRRDVSRWTLARHDLHVPVRGTNVRVKVARLRGEVVNISPEFDDCVHVAERAGVPFKEIHAEAAEKARRLLEG